MWCVLNYNNYECLICYYVPMAEKKTIEIRNIQYENLQISNNVHYKAASIINYNCTLRLYSHKLLTAFLSRWEDFRQFHLLDYGILTLCNFSTVSISSCQR